VDGWNAAQSRRWQRVAAIAGALSLFVALIAGSSLRTHYTASALPEPGAWTHTIQDAQPHVSRVQMHGATPTASSVKTGFSPHSAPTLKKPFRNVWMTKDLPPSWIPLSPQFDWMALPKSFTATEFQPPGTQWAASAAASGNRRNTLTLFRIVRC
jgi:hypothetical protein